ncbi:MAG: Spy/CpxP family protein refolding chaperone [Candidatus Omnitrophica bacterium]|nr:Spy/CpxP family protein refolding chaperone [Candidatus Omnitrophota bacterium]
MSVKTKIAGITVALMALSIPLVHADFGDDDMKSAPSGKGECHHGMTQMLGDVLGLSEDQVKQIKDIDQKKQEAKKAVFEQLKSNRQAFESEIVKALPDMNKINTLQTELKAIKSQMIDNELNSTLAIKKIMTPEQFAGFMALEKAKKMMMHKRFEGRLEKKEEFCRIPHRGEGPMGEKAQEDKGPEPRE